ncbi:hypothetical protein ZIOFF_010494 [Zingiber officinale]|uniref:Uncharacterized protein n=1 Tax=Zingiber officinale TaxID=94328 RepID=A0A8J5I5Z6_ZINOF|nr:hypothetical protein ZIOFF_010494 [Zingiber officinale]
MNEVANSDDSKMRSNGIATGGGSEEGICGTIEFELDPVVAGCCGDTLCSVLRDFFAGVAFHDVTMAAALVIEDLDLWSCSECLLIFLPSDACKLSYLLMLVITNYKKSSHEEPIECIQYSAAAQVSGYFNCNSPFYVQYSSALGASGSFNCNIHLDLYAWFLYQSKVVSVLLNRIAHCTVTHMLWHCWSNHPSHFDRLADFSVLLVHSYSKCYHCFLTGVSGSCLWLSGLLLYMLNRNLCLIAIYIGALSMAAFVISITTISAIITAVVATGM